MSDKNYQFNIDDRPLNMLSTKELEEWKLAHGINEESLQEARSRIEKWKRKAMSNKDNQK